MSELTHGAMLVGALAGAACAIAGARQGRVLDVGTSIVMLAAMVDTAITGLVPALVWAAVLVAAGIALGARMRVARSRSGGPDGRPVELLGDLHRALAFIVSGWLMVGAAASVAVPSTAHDHGAAGGLAPIAGALTVLALGGWLITRLLRSGRGAWHAAEAASMSVMLAAMAWPTVTTALG